MSKHKPMSPYEWLRRKVVKFLNESVFHRKAIPMFHYFVYSKGQSVPPCYRLDDLYSRVAAAEQLGYDALLITEPDWKLSVVYKKKVPGCMEDLPDDLRFTLDRW